MKALDVVLLQREARTDSLASALGQYLPAIHVAGSIEDLREIAVKLHPRVAVIDMEMVDFSEIEQLKHDSGDTYLVCTHRLADEEMWIKALDIGASDFCFSDDISGIVAAVVRCVPIPDPIAA